MDIKKMIEELVEKITKGNMIARFEKEPVAVIEELVGMDLPDEIVEKLVEGVKAKISLDKVGNVLGGLGSLFGKK